jgi:hypothetical protein
MKFAVERLPDTPVVLITIGDQYVVGKDTADLQMLVDSRVGAGETGLYAIWDLRKFPMTFSALVQGMGNQAQKAPGAMADPRLNTIIIGSSELVKLGIEAFKQAQYGGLKFPLYETVDEALAYVRAQTGKT